MEKIKVKRNRQVNSEGIRIVKLGKMYSKYPFGIKSIKDYEALRNIYLEVKKNELLAILGHNGAGKSTLINVLTGQLDATSGTAEFLNYNI